MDAAESLADLKQISTQIVRAVIVRADGSVAGSTVTDEPVSSSIAGAGVRLWDAADRARRDLGRPELSQLEVATGEGSVFAVRDEEHLIVAVTAPEPTVGLIFYDLKTCLRNLRERPEDADVAVDAGGVDDAGRKAVAFLLAAGSVAGTMVLRRRRGRGRTRVDLYFDDGSMLSLGDDSPEALAVVPAAIDVLTA